MRVVCYYRMSTDEQAASIEQQRTDCRAFCARNGWVIVAEYTDSGLSGSKEIHKRVEFHQMIADSARGEWKAVVVWKSCRFSRQDALDAAEPKRQLRANGVHMESLKEGRIEWNTTMGRMMDFMRSEQNHDYAVAIGDASIRGRMNVVRLGFWPHGQVPYGFDREYWSGGQPVAVLARGAQSVKARGWRLKLAVNEIEAAAVRWLFEQYATRDVSLRQLAIEVNARGGPLPLAGRGAWSREVVRDVLRNPAYVGDTAVGYNGRSSRRGAKVSFNRCEQTIIPHTHPPIVDRDTFVQVQEKLDRIKQTGRRVRGAKGSPLCGVIVCGHCGYRMVRVRSGNAARFKCNSACTRPHLGCRQWTVRESDMLTQVCAELVDAVDYEILQRMQAKPEQRKRVAASEIASLTKKAAELEKKTRRADENLLLADPADYQRLKTIRDGWLDDLNKVKNTLKLAEAEAAGEGPLDPPKSWEQIKATLVTVAGGMYACDGRNTREVRPPLKATPDVLREMLHRLNVKVVLHWLPNGDRYYKLDYERCRLTAEFGEKPIQGDTVPRRSPRTRTRSGRGRRTARTASGGSGLRAPRRAPRGGA